MEESRRPGTWATLLARLKVDPSNQAAWDSFVAHYGPVVRGWCLRWHLQDADIEDVTQNVLLRLSLKLPEFDYDSSRSFRAWLKTLTRVATDAVKARVAPQTWEAFRLTAIEGLSGAEAAAKIPMQVSQVYVAKRRVQKMLQEDLARLDDAYVGPAGAASE